MRFPDPFLFALTSVAGLLLAVAPSPAGAESEPTDLVRVVQQVQPKLVKIYGAGGLRGLEAYQSGFLISPDGLVLTAWSYVLDADPVIVVMHDGLRREAELIGADPVREIALLRIDVQDNDYFPLQQAVTLDVGSRVLAFSNLYGIATGNEPLSVQEGVVMAVSQLQLRKGAFPSPYRGEVILIDAMTNNPGAAGGALTDAQGRLAGILGKEVRESRTGTWVNYALPIAALRETIESLRRGLPPPGGPADEPQRSPAERPWTLVDLGLRLVPDLLPVTPPFVESVLPGGPAYRAGLRSDDLITFVQDRLVRSQEELIQELTYLPRHQPLNVSVMRGTELLSLTISSEP